MHSVCVPSANCEMWPQEAEPQAPQQSRSAGAGWGWDAVHPRTCRGRQLHEGAEPRDPYHFAWLQEAWKGHSAL